MITYRSESVVGQFSGTNLSEAHIDTISIMNDIAKNLPENERILQLVYLGTGSFPFLIIEVSS